MNCHRFSSSAYGASSARCFLNFSSCTSTNQSDSCVNRFVTYFNNNSISSQYHIRGCINLTQIVTYPKYSSTRDVRRIWEKWDLPVLVLYILFTQLYLHVFGRGRGKGTTRRSVINLNVWLIYLLADLVAAIALGKLSNVKKDVEGHVDDPRSLVRGMWAPIILFYLGGPDTIIVLTLEENQMWLKHLVGLLTQGLRTSYVLYVTWTYSWLSVVALGMLIPGIIKYSERVWVIRSRVRGTAEGFVQLDDNNTSGCSPNEPVIEAYSCFQTLKPHIPDYGCDRTRLGNLVKDFRKWATSVGDDKRNVDVFKLIEIELGFMYDVLFSKIGVIFTVWGCILRFISFSCIVCVLVGFFWVMGNDLMFYYDLRSDLYITVVLLLGAILLEIGGVLVQLGSDWAVVWSYKLPTAPSTVSTIILCLRKLVICKSRKRWAGLLGQFSLIDYCNKYEPTMCNEMMNSICGGLRTLKMKFSLPSSPVTADVKKLIIVQLSERLQNVVPKEVETPLTFSAMTRGETALQECGALQALKWSVEFEFHKSLIVWHIATEVCYRSETAKPEVMEPTRMLSNYMMHLLLIRASTFPICSINVDPLKQKVCNDMKEILKGKGSVSNAEACQLLLDEKNISRNVTVLSRAQELVHHLKADDSRWTIMSKVWVEMLCYAASRCSLKHHAHELRYGGEFITHVWLLLQHFGVRKSPDENRPAADETEVLTGALENLPSAVGMIGNMSCWC